MTEHTRLPLRRRDLLTTAAGAAFAAALRPLPSLAGDHVDDLVLRRPMDPGEDEYWYKLCQNGPWNPESSPISMSFGISRLIVHFPRNLKSARLVVFSHGALKDPIIYRPLLQHITSHGYVVVAPVHDDSVIEKGLLARTANSQGASTWDIDRVLNDVFAWEARTEGCRTVLEHVDRISEACGININAERPVIVGHEFGAYTAQLLLGAVVNDNGGKISRFNDDRWYSGVLMASQGTGIMGLDDQSWSGMTRPLVVVQAALETDFTNQTPQAKIDAFTMSPPGNKHLLWFTRADTTMYTPTRTPHSLRERQQNDDLRASVTAGITAYANYDQNLFSMLASDWPERASSQRILASYR